MAANLPGVPVPPGLRYSPAGDGGPDGLRLIRHVLDRAGHWLRPGAGGAAGEAVLIMRFQSLGGARRPMLLDELPDRATANGWDVTVLADSRVSVDVRRGLTGFYAAEHNPGLDIAELLARTDAHARRLGMTHYYSCSLVAYPGSGQVRFVPLAAESRLDIPVRVSAAAEQHAAAVEAHYRGLAYDLPDGFWELGDRTAVELPIIHRAGLTTSLAAHRTARAAVHDIFAAELSRRPAHARTLYTTAELLVDAMIAAGVATPAEGGRSTS